MVPWMVVRLLSRSLGEEDLYNSAHGLQWCRDECEHFRDSDRVWETHQEEHDMGEVALRGRSHCAWQTERLRALHPERVSFRAYRS